MRAADGPGRRDSDERSIAVAIARDRRLVPPTGVTVTRTHSLDQRALWNLGPPRMRYDEAALDVALIATGEFGVISAVARAVQSRHTTAVRMRAVLDGRSRAPRRDFVAGVLDDVATGTCSVLEHGYLMLIEKPHGLPPAERQQREVTASGVVYRDVVLGTQPVELDGRLFHDSADQRDADYERDLDVAVQGRGTLRLSWGQIYQRACSTAAKLALVLRRQGLEVGHPCAEGCPVTPLT